MMDTCHGQLDRHFSRDSPRITCNGREKSEIHLFCASAVKRLQDQDARLPQASILEKVTSWRTPCMA